LTPPVCVLLSQVNNPFAIDWPLLQAMPAAEQLLISGALLCLFREIFVKSATVSVCYLGHCLACLVRAFSLAGGPL
jgi:hypothetical protein